jgi:hypothetical protein
MLGIMQFTHAANHTSQKRPRRINQIANATGERIAKYLVPPIRMAFVLLLAVLLIAPGTLSSRAANGDDATELAKQTQNPVADLISVPFEYDFSFNTGIKNATVSALNVEPIIPLHLNTNWNLITRTIVPLVNEPSLSPGVRSASGLGDINPSFFLSPAKSSWFMWGIGPTFTLPTATSSLLGSQKLSLGPAAVGIVMKGPWLGGVLVNNQWSVASWGSKEAVNEMLLEPFVNYNFGKGWHLSTELIMTADWRANPSERWTVPIGAGIGKLFFLGKLPMDSTLEAFDNVEHPKYEADWQLRFRVTFLLPGF